MSKTKKYAIIDIETTGGTARRDKITEIGVVITDGKKVLKTFHSLVNPERSIPPHITRITGITDDMVQDAPFFYEIAKELVEITDGTIFVAHNVRFDYGFIKEEFSKLGYTFTKRQLCTVKLSRKAFPGLRSYSLGNLISHFDIPVNARHRALEDAEATAIIFHKILESPVAMDSINQFVSAGIKEAKLPPGISMEQLHELPESPGVYYLRSEGGVILYVGKSKNIRKRVLQHFSKITSKSDRFAKRVRQVSCEETGSELIALLKESHEIKSIQPEFNRAQRTRTYPFFIHYFIDLSGYIRFEILKSSVKTRAGKNILSYHKNSVGAKSRLGGIMREFELCQNLCGLEDADHACFQYKINACSGACIKEEIPENYNERAMLGVQAIQRIIEKDMIIIDKGRTHDEASVILVEDGDFKGFGYIPSSDVQYGIEELKEAIEDYPVNKEANRIIQSYLKKYSLKTIYI